MRIALPLESGRLNAYFGQSQHFAWYEVDARTKKILDRRQLRAPAHRCGLYPAWLHQLGATLVIARGMGAHARQLLASHQIDVVTGATADRPESLVRAFLSGDLQCRETGSGCPGRAG